MIALLEKFKIKPRNISLYQKALTHSSYVNENAHIKEDLEKLEFLGDAVLQLFVSELIYTSKIAKNEGEMTLMRIKLVRTESLYELASEIELGKYLYVGVGAEKSGVRTAKNILADVFESFIGAIYLDQGYRKTKRIIRKIFMPEIKKIKVTDLIDHKTKLQELLVSDKRGNIKYVEISRVGTPNNPTFEFAVMLDDNIEIARGKGKTKKEAHQQAAYNALKKCAV